MQKTPGTAAAQPYGDTADRDAQHFIARWQGVALTAATELSTSQTFVIELCALLGVPKPLPNDAFDDVFERSITSANGDNTEIYPRYSDGFMLEKALKITGVAVERKKLRRRGARGLRMAAVVA